MLRARINATGEVVDVRPYQHEVFDFMVCRNEGMMGELYTRDELTIIGDNELEYPHDYWTRLEHQYAGMAMQGLCANAKFMQDHEGDFQCHEEMIADYAKDIAHALMKKYKEEERK